jgi:hypothetical protein
MIALDTNILARFYVEDPGDPGAANRRPIDDRRFARRARRFGTEPKVIVPTG